MLRASSPDCPGSLTETLPLHVEAMYNNDDFVGAFAAASLPAGLANVTVIAKTALERLGGKHATMASSG